MIVQPFVLHKLLLRTIVVRYKEKGQRLKVKGQSLNNPLPLTPYPLCLITLR